MNHQPFRHWMLSEEQLSDEQAQALQDHLASCAACSQIGSRWEEVEYSLQHSPQVGPAAGFTARFEQRLAVQQSLQEARKGWFSITATALIAVTLFGFFAYQVWMLLKAPEPYMVGFLNHLLSLVTDYFIVQNILRTHSLWSVGYVAIGMFFLVGMISFMSVLWATAYKKLSLARRIV